MNDFTEPYKGGKEILAKLEIKSSFIHLANRSRVPTLLYIPIRISYVTMKKNFSFWSGNSIGDLYKK